MCHDVSMCLGVATMFESAVCVIRVEKLIVYPRSQMTLIDVDFTTKLLQP